MHRQGITAILAALALLLQGCGGNEGDGTLSPEEMTLLQGTAGRLARHWCLPEDNPGWLPPPGEDDMATVRDICSRRQGAWTYFYRCMSDTANVLEPPAFGGGSADPGEDSVYVADDDDRE